MTAARNVPTFAELRNGGDLKEIDRLSPEEIFLLQDDLRERKTALQQDQAFFNMLLKDRFGGNIDEHYKHRQEDTGTVRFGIGDGYEIKAVKKKVVQWSQNGLADLYERIQQAGDNAEVYIQKTVSVSYSVAEAAYKTWPAEIQGAFADARTVKPSEAVIEIEKTKEK